MSLIHGVNFMADEPEQDFVIEAVANIKKKINYLLLVKTAHIQ